MHTHIYGIGTGKERDKTEAKGKGTDGTWRSDPW